MAGTEGLFTALAALLDLVLMTFADLTSEVVAGAVALGLRGAMMVLWRLLVLWQLGGGERERESVGPRQLSTGVKVGEDDVDKHALRLVTAAIFLPTNFFATITEIVHRYC